MNGDIFITKLKSDGSSLLFSTYFGGSGEDLPGYFKFDQNGDIFICGETSSLDFETSSGAFDRTLDGNSDAFVIKLKKDGSSLLFSTLLGGSEAENKCYMDLDSSGNIFITGITSSSDFPTTSGVFDETFNGGGDVYVLQLKSDGTDIIFSSFIGGSDNDHFASIDVDPIGDIIITGYTQSTDFPTTSGAFDETHGGINDIFIFKMESDGTDLLFSTFIGGNANEHLSSGNDRQYQVNVNQYGNIIISHQTNSTDFPTTPDAFDTTYNGSYDIVIYELSNDGSNLIYSTYFGGSNSRQP